MVLPLLDRARKEIVVSLYLMEPQDKAGPTFSVNRLFESLLRARQRGVRIRLYLNTNFRFKPKTEVGDGLYFERLAQAGELLKQEGIDINSLSNGELEKHLGIGRGIIMRGRESWT